MKSHNKVLAIFFIVITTLCFFDSINNVVSSNGTGAPPAETGSPGDGGATCTDCHIGPLPGIQTGWITSNVPSGGYVPGNTYTITATAVRANHVKFGFEISPQDPTGTLLGTIVITNAIQTKLVGGGNYITHTAAGTSGVGSRTWTFDWIAPSAGTGIVTFYGAFNITNNSGNNSGDTIMTSTMDVAECTTPLQPSLISGNTVVCPNTVQVYSVTPDPDATGYDWVLPPGWSGTSNTETISATSSSASGTIYVAALNDCGSGPAQSLNVTATQISLAVSPTNVSCAGGGNGLASVTPSGGNSPYSYSWNTSPVQNSATATGLLPGTYMVTVTDANSCTNASSVIISQPSPVTLSVSHNNVGCNGGANGSATGAGGGGSPGYTYSWNTSPVQTSATANNLPAATYIVTVTDVNGCTQTSSVVISQPSIISLSTSHSDATCNGGANGTATVTASGGTPGFTYAWSTSPVQTSATAINLGAGTYNVIVTDANGCTKTSSIVVNQPTAISLTTGHNNVTCNGGANGTATITTTGGTPGYTYSWNTNPVQTSLTAVNLGAGTYTVTVTDANGCTKTSSVAVSQPAVLSLSFSHNNISCNGGANGSATVTANGGNPGYTYSWNTSPVQSGTTAVNLISGTYTATVTDVNGCTMTSSVTVAQPTVLSLSGTHTNVGCNGGSNGSATIVASGGTFGYTYVWNSIPGQTTATAVNLLSGTYTVTVTDANGCSRTSSASITQPAAITVSSTQNNVRCNGGSNGSASMTPGGGTPPYTYSWNTIPPQSTATATSLSAAIYIVTVSDSHGCTKTSSVTITEPSVINLSSAHTDVNCHGGLNGSASVTATGGNPGYTYSWNTIPVQSTITATNLSAGNYIVTVSDANACTNSTSVSVTEPTSISLVSGSTNADCGQFNGSAFVSASGGVPGYSYSWNTSPVQSDDTAVNLLPGIYSVIVTDSMGCIDSTIVSVNNTSGTLLSIQALADVTCYGGNNGTASISVSSGTPPFSYLWTPGGDTSNSASSLSAGNYVVTVNDSNNCITAITVTISEPNEIILTSSFTNVNCNAGTDGSALVSVTGGIPGYTYTWNTNPVQNTAIVSGLTAGTYMVSVLDSNGCVKSDSVTLSQPSPLIVDAGIDNTICEGDSVLIGNLSGASGGIFPYFYNWAPASGLSSDTMASAFASPAATQLYILTVIDSNGCAQSSSCTITVNSLPTAPGITQSYDTLFSSFGSTYQWFIHDSLLSGSVMPYCVPAHSGNYTVTITDVNGCSSTSLPFPFIMTQITSYKLPDNISLFPNPASEKITIKIDSNSGSSPLFIYDMIGNLVSTSTLNSRNNIVEVSGLVTGVYIARIGDVSSNTYVYFSVMR